MRRTRLAFAVGGITILAIFGSAAAAVSGGDGKGPSPTPGKGARLNPDAGLTPSQRDAAYRTMQAAFERKYESWLHSPVAMEAAKDPRALAQQELLNSPTPGAPSLDAAMATAEAVVAGTVTRIAFEPNDTLVTFRVDGVAKGKAPPEVTVVLPGGLRPTSDFQHAFLAVSAAAPILLPGDRAVLFLNHQSGSAADRFVVPSFTGLYPSANGKLSPIAGNPFAQDVAGMSETQLVTRVREQG